jgi:hypothetical protein
MSYFIIGGTNVAVGKKSRWDKSQVVEMSVVEMSEALMSVGQKSRHPYFDKKNALLLLSLRNIKEASKF